MKLLHQAMTVVLEIFMLGGYFLCGFSIEATPVIEWIAGLALLGFAILKWGLFVSPKAKHRLRDPWLSLYRVKLMAIAAAAYYVSGHANFALGFVLVVGINELLALFIAKRVE